MVETAITTNNLAVAYTHLGDLATAEALLEVSLEVGVRRSRELCRLVLMGLLLSLLQR